jgi:hypothetical protein
MRAKAARSSTYAAIVLATAASACGTAVATSQKSGAGGGSGSTTATTATTVASTGGSGGSALAGGGRSGTAGAAGASSTIPFDQDGTVPYAMQVDQVTTGGMTFTVTSYVPTTPGLHPAVSFSCGSTQTAAGYVPYGQRLASYGIAMLLTDDPGLFTNTGAIVPGAVYIAGTWLPTTFAGKIDPARVGLGGHSRGGAVSLLAAEQGLAGKVVAWFGLDPVDDEFLMAPTEYARTDLPQIGIPTGYLGASVVTNCAPATDGYMTLYPLSPSPSVLLVGQGASHTYFELASGCTGCGICTPTGPADPTVVLAYAVRYFTAFFARELLGDTSVGAAFQGAGAPADVAAGLVTVTSK